ncbi:hypothetical protein ASD93_05435 [Microbacterium sp. Root180]|nr:hypothetical protein ASD93_05435 [Microbacterium sp. Root180]
MTKNKRYEAHYDRLNDERMREASPSPCTLPSSAYGPQSLERVPRGQSEPAVWAWVNWPHKRAERLEAFAVAWNDRAVIVEWDGVGGSRNTVVWRNAVARRGSSSGPSDAPDCVRP